jgi:hypothetical protein
LFLGVLALLLVAWSAAGAAGHGLAAPSIVGFSPTHGVVGARVTIYGHNLQGAQMVQFNGVAAASPVVNAAGNHIVVVVPPETNIGPGAITITTPGGTVSSTAKFVVVSAGGTKARIGVRAAGRPAIRAISPMHAMPGARVAIRGTNLAGALWVRFAGMKATFTVPAADRIVAIVPAHARSGAISVGTSRGSVTFRGFTVSGRT